MFTLKIETDNKAFEGDPHVEVARILEHLAANMIVDHGTIRDANGNTVGEWVFS